MSVTFTSKTCPGDFEINLSNINAGEFLRSLDGDYYTEELYGSIEPADLPLFTMRLAKIETAGWETLVEPPSQDGNIRYCGRGPEQVQRYITYLKALAVYCFNHNEALTWA